MLPTMVFVFCSTARCNRTGEFAANGQNRFVALSITLDDRGDVDLHFLHRDIGDLRRREPSSVSANPSNAATYQEIAVEYRRDAHDDTSDTEDRLAIELLGDRYSAWRALWCRGLLAPTKHRSRRSD